MSEEVEASPVAPDLTSAPTATAAPAVPDPVEEELEEEKNNAELDAARKARFEEIKNRMANSKRKESDDFLRSIAHDLYTGAIFCNRHISRNEAEHILQMVFMPLALMSPENIEKMMEDPPDFMYEYIKEAGPRGINGYPMFFSVRMLNTADTKRMLELYTEIKTAMDAVMGKKDKPKEPAA